MKLLFYFFTLIILSCDRVKVDFVKNDTIDSTVVIEKKFKKWLSDTLYIIEEGHYKNQRIEIAEDSLNLTMIMMVLHVLNQNSEINEKQ